MANVLMLRMDQTHSLAFVMKVGRVVDLPQLVIRISMNVLFLIHHAPSIVDYILLVGILFCVF